MVARRILEWPHPGLRKKSSDVTEFNDELALLVSDMKDTLSVSYGAGLAAPQIGQHKRVVVINCSSFDCENPTPGDDSNTWVIVNPELECSVDKTSWKEACLSVPGAEAWVERSTSLKLRYQDTEGNHHELDAEWPLAGALQHECDHLEGRLYLSRLSWYNRQTIEKKIRKRRRKAAEIRAAAEEERRRDLESIYGTTKSRPERKKDPMRRKRKAMAKQSRKKNRKKK